MLRSRHLLGSTKFRSVRQRKAVRYIVGIHVVASDYVVVVDAGRVGTLLRAASRPRRIERPDDAFGIAKEAVVGVPRIDVITGDGALRVHRDAKSTLTAS